MALRRARVLVLAVAALALLTGGRSLAQSGPQLHTKVGGVSSETLVVASPEAVADPALAMVRVMIAPGASIPEHRHTGTQIASIISGDLTYSVDTGEVDLYRLGSTPGKDAPTVLGPGTTTVLRPGDAIVEHPGSLHQATNAGTVPVLLFSSILFPSAAGATVYATTAATPEPEASPGP